MTELLKEDRPELLPEFVENFDESDCLTIAEIFKALVGHINNQGIKVKTIEGFTVSEQFSIIAVNAFLAMRRDLEHWRQLDSTTETGNGNG